MKTVLNVKTDKVIKDKAQALAKHMGIPLSTIVNAQLKHFIESGEFTVSRELTLKSKVVTEINKAVQEVRTGKKISPRFKRTEDALTWLNG
jgi:addiction module RelB/DinJ family antitoxin